MRPPGLRQRLEKALLTEEEMQLGPAEWAKWPNTFRPRSGKDRRKRLAKAARVVQNKMKKQKTAATEAAA